MKIKIIEKYKNMIGLRINSPLHKGKNKNYVFIHINKNAGTSIIGVIGKPFRKHLTVKDVIRVIGQKKWDEAYKFTVIRNPWDKVVSQYKHNIKMNVTNMAKKKIEFKDWVACTYGEPKNKFYYNRAQMFFPQIEWLKNYEEKIDIDKIIRFENLNEGVNEVFKTLEIDTGLPHLNSTYKANYRGFYNEETKQIITDWFHEDIKEFGYTF
ncbi:MAG: sulfotransferase family 2 domain-containing protein [Flavobacteriaceae bacterium]|nr:sulfotransferase family 2 domain-containing protein [Flavobacteriaceae bacterium]